MKRIAGYINLNSILRIDKRFSSPDGFVRYLRHSKPYIEVQKNSVTETKFIISFNIRNTKYYFKYDEDENPYAELIAEELAHSMNLPCVDYDIATIGGFVGSISKDYTSKDEISTISGEEVISFSHDNGDVLSSFGATNNLEAIWMGLIGLFKNYPNNEEIVETIMKKIVDMYVFDIITKQLDRHSFNWEIVKYKDGHFDLRPLFDNARIVFKTDENPSILLRVTSKTSNIDKNISEFNRISSEEFNKLIKDNLWIISHDNIIEVFNRVEEKIGNRIPAVVKQGYLERFAKHLEFIETCLNNEVEKKKGV